MDLDISRRQFLTLATLLQGSLMLLAFGLAWLVGINLLGAMKFDGRALLLGGLGAVPMLVFFIVTYWFPWGPLRRIKQFLLEALGPTLVRSRWYDLVWVAVLAGVSEELLFRGVLQSGLNQFGWGTGLLVSNLVFGLAHAVTPTYAVLAGLLGAYLGVLFQVVGDQNLLVPIISHALYDLVAFFLVRHSFPRPGR